MSCLYERGFQKSLEVLPVFFIANNQKKKKFYYIVFILEVPKTDKSFEERLIFKTFILKFVNAFSPIIYIAFFRGRLVTLL